MTKEVLAARIDADGVYADGDVRLLFGLTSATLSRARRDGTLRYSRQGNCLLYRGAWLLEWLERDADRRAEQQAEVPHV